MIRRMPKPSGQATVLATDWPLVDLQLDGDHLYWNSGEIHRMPKSGGPVETIVAAAEVQLSSDLAFDAEHVYFIGAQSIARAPKAGGPVQALFAAETGHAANPMVHDGVVWWTENDWKVLKRAELGGEVETVDLGRDAFVGGMAWSDGLLVLDAINRRLLRVDSTGKAATVKQFDARPGRLAVFGKAVYVTIDRADSTPGSVRRY